jgi:hypothetical protein
LHSVETGLLIAQHDAASYLTTNRYKTRYHCHTHPTFEGTEVGAKVSPVSGDPAGILRGGAARIALDTDNLATPTS